MVCFWLFMFNFCLLIFLFMFFMNVIMKLINFFVFIRFACVSSIKNDTSYFFIGARRSILNVFVCCFSDL